MIFRSFIISEQTKKCHKIEPPPSQALSARQDSWQIYRLLITPMRTNQTGETFTSDMMILFSFLFQIVNLLIKGLVGMAQCWGEGVGEISQNRDERSWPDARMSEAVQWKPGLKCFQFPGNPLLNLTITYKQHYSLSSIPFIGH